MPDAPPVMSAVFPLNVLIVMPSVLSLTHQVSLFSVRGAIIRESADQNIFKLCHPIRLQAARKECRLEANNDVV